MNFQKMIEQVQESGLVVTNPIKGQPNYFHIKGFSHNGEFIKRGEEAVAVTTYKHGDSGDASKDDFHGKPQQTISAFIKTLLT
jgi:hypothetical protein